MRLVDADALEKAISESHSMIDDYGIKIGYEICMRLVEDAPTIESRCETCEAFNKTRLLIPQPQQQKGKLMRRRTFEEMITYFNQTVSDMDIDRKYKITLLGIVTALLQKHDEDVAQIEPQRKKGKWIYGESEAGNDGYYCSKCGNFVPWKYDEYDIDFIKEFLFCNKCGAEMRNSVETARDIVHEAINNSVWSDTVDTAKMHKVVDDKYAEIRGGCEC